MTIIQNPTQFKIPTWFLNRQKDIVDGKNSQILSNGVDSKIRDDLERLKKIRAHRGLRHFWGLRVRGQHTKTTGAFSSFSFTPGNLILLQAVAARPLVCPRSVVRYLNGCHLSSFCHIAVNVHYFHMHLDSFHRSPSLTIEVDEDEVCRIVT